MQATPRTIGRSVEDYQEPFQRSIKHGGKKKQRQKKDHKRYENYLKPDIYDRGDMFHSLKGEDSGRALHAAILDISRGIERLGFICSSLYPLRMDISSYTFPSTKVK